MPDIRHDLLVRAPLASVWRALVTPAGLDAWWTLRSAGEPVLGADYELDFGPGYVWRGSVQRCEPERALEWEIRDAHEDWEGTRVGFELEESEGRTQVRFHHAGWKQAGAHYRGSCYCWAMYLRVMKRHVEHGEWVDYGERLEV